MTPRPFYRWKSFWFGLLVLVFLGWVWADSQRHGAVVYRMNFLEGGRRRCFVYDEGVSQQRGRIMFHGSRLKMREPGLSVVAEPLIFRHGRAMDGGGWFVKPLVVTVENDDMKEVTIVSHWVGVPMWCVAGGYLFLWGGVLWWWRRRVRRLVRAGEGI